MLRDAVPVVVRAGDPAVPLTRGTHEGGGTHGGGLQRAGATTELHNALQGDSNTEGTSGVSWASYGRAVPAARSDAAPPHRAEAGGIASVLRGSWMSVAAVVTLAALMGVIASAGPSGGASVSVVGLTKTKPAPPTSRTATASLAASTSLLASASPSHEASASPSHALSRTASPSASVSVTGAAQPEDTARIVVGAGINLSTSAWNHVRAQLDCKTTLGAWVLQEERAVIVPAALTGDSNCGDPPYDSTKRPGLWYSWIAPPQCPLTPFSKRALCRTVAGRDVLIVGDSMNFMLHDVFTSAMLRSVAGHGQQDTCPWHTMCEDEELETKHLGPGKQLRRFRLKFIRNDRLSLRAQEYRETTAFIEFPWIQDVRDGMIVIMNRGAHYEADDKVVRELRETFDWMRTRFPDTLVIFRNTPPGHDEPVRGDLPIKERLREPGYDATRYHWDRFYTQNLAVQSLIAQEFPGLVYLDVDNATALRVDNHRDGLHYCIPGPVDWWLVFILNALDDLRRAAV